jgi:hypothetical protein
LASSQLPFRLCHRHRDTRNGIHSLMFKGRRDHSHGGVFDFVTGAST